MCGYRGGIYGDKKDGTKRISPDSWLQVIENGFDGAVECETPLLDESKLPVTGWMIESEGEAREKPDPLINEAWSPQAFDAALMQPAQNEGDAVSPVSPSRLCDDDPTDPSPLPSDDENGSVVWSSAERGTLMHGLLERLASVPPEDRRTIGEQGLTSQHDLAALDTVLAILDSPDFSWMFAEGSLAEVPIAGPVVALDGRAVSGSIDRLIVRDGRVDIVDFKSGQPHDPMPEAYQRQLAVYQSVLQEIYPTSKVVAHLLWIDVPRLDTLDETASQSARARARQQLVSSG